VTDVAPPRRLRLELGLDCPLLCLHCSANAAPGHPGVMPSELAHRLVREFAEMGGKEVTLTGGEPLVHPGLPALLGLARMVGLETVVFTSGIVHAAPDRAAAPAAYLESLASVMDRAVFSLYRFRWFIL
jgi:MoaA/NifB/PqqE/SkfB family radical SAM enzyme